jgi:hypothetical protein
MRTAVRWRNEWEDRRRGRKENEMKVGARKEKEKQK